VRLLLLALLAALLLPGSAPAQQTADYPERELEYRAARSAYEAALDAWNVREKQWSDALDAHGLARRNGDQRQQDASYTRALDLSRELDVLERRVIEQGTGLRRARSALLAAVAQRITMIERQRAAARTAAEANQLGAVLRDLENQRDELEAETVGVTFQPVYYESIQYDPRDDAEMLGAKAELLRSKVTQVDTMIAQIDREIGLIERQERRGRNVEALLTGVERFGDIQAPGAPGRRPEPGDARARPDSAGVARPPASAQQRIMELRLLKVELESARQSFLERAESFDAMIRRII
jgi:hypothetical protein